MATAPSLPDPAPSSPTRIRVRVGLALWTVSLSADAARALLLEDERSTGSALALDLDRAMESMRRKALDLRLFGGGSILLEAKDLAAPLAPVFDEQGQPLPRPRWFSIAEPHANDVD